MYLQIWVIFKIKKKSTFEFIIESNFNIYDLFTASLFIMNIIVAVIFFLLLLRTFSIHLFLSKEIIQFPHFLLLNPLVSCISLPILFLMIVFEKYQRKIKWYDSLHFLPALLFLVNYWTLYTKSASEKLEIITKIYQQGYNYIRVDGLLLSNNMVLILRVAPFVFYTKSYFRNY